MVRLIASDEKCECLREIREGVARLVGSHPKGASILREAKKRAQAESKRKRECDRFARRFSRQEERLDKMLVRLEKHGLSQRRKIEMVRESLLLEEKSKKSWEFNRDTDFSISPIRDALGDRQMLEILESIDQKSGLELNAIRRLKADIEESKERNARIRHAMAMEGFQGC